MYETYVPITETIVERRPPTIAEIVRQKTDDGARIIDFFLDVMEGRVDGAMLCHRIDAAKQLVKYGYKKAADFIAEHRDETCDHCESRKRGPRPRKDQSPAAGPPYASPHLTPDFLTLLTEDFLTVVSAVDEDLMIKLVRAQTRDGGTVIDFLDNVMHGREKSFKVNHRISAARELISHILRDEHVIARTVLEVVADPRVRPLPGSQTPAPSTLAPSPSTGEGRGEGDTTTITVVPAKAGFLPQEPSPIQGGGRARGATLNGASAEPVPSAVKEPTIVRPEPVLSAVEGPEIVRPEPVEGQCSADSAFPGPAASEADPTVVPAKAGFLPQEPSPTQGGGGARRVAGRIREKPEARWHEPDSWDGPIDSTTPGRSPPC